MFVVATYHHVDEHIPESAHPKLWVHESIFRNQLAAIARRVVPLDEALVGKEGVVLTLDDGYRSCYSSALPELERLGLPATAYVSTGKVGLTEFEPDYGFEVAYMGQGEIRDAERRGLSVQLHGRSHRRLSTLSAEDLETEISAAVAEYGELLGRKPRHFCYPYGDKSPLVAETVRGHGLVSSMTCELGWNDYDTDPLLLRRFAVETSWSGAELNARIDTLMGGKRW